MKNKPLSVALAGFGTVGSGLAGLLQTNAEFVRQHIGRDIVIRKILVRDVTKSRNVALPESAILTDKAAELLEDPEIDVFVELIGGIEPARSLVEQALEHGKHVVTANKALLAEAGQPLFSKAMRLQRILRYEASVAGAIPIVQALKEGLVGNQILSLTGILNGTSNYILSEMANHQLDFQLALKQAQEQGFAEADPSLDIDGQDAAHKLILLIRLAFGVHYPFEKLYIRGIRNISSLDIRLAGEFGYNIKLIGQAQTLQSSEKQPVKLAAGVFPALAKQKSLMAKVEGSFNAIKIEANGAGELFFHGRGAGSWPTAGAVLSDLMAVARDERPNNTGFATDILPEAVTVPSEQWRSPFYVRVMVSDTPGMLRDIAGCMASEGVSIAQVIQRAVEGYRTIPLVLMMHESSASAIDRALQKITQMGLLQEPAVYFKVLD